MKIRVVLNPKSKSGGQEYIGRTLKEKFSQCLISIEETAYPGHAIRMAQKAAQENADTLVVVGGDGTVNEVLNGIAGTNIKLGIIPTGTANDLATLYHIPTDVAGACDVILENNLSCLDLICVNGRYYVTSGGIGLPGEVVRIANKIKLKSLVGRFVGQFLGSRIYLLAVLCALLKKSKQGHLMDIQWEDCSLNMDPLAFMVDNQPFLGRDFLISPGAINNDGLLDICLIKNSKSRIQTFTLLFKVRKGSHIHLPSVRRWQTCELIVQTEESLPFFGDGEVFGQSSQFSIKIVPKALRVIVPKANISQG